MSCNHYGWSRTGIYVSPHVGNTQVRIRSPGHVQSIPCSLYLSFFLFSTLSLFWKQFQCTGLILWVFLIHITFKYIIKILFYPFMANLSMVRSHCPLGCGPSKLSSVSSTWHFQVLVVPCREKAGPYWPALSRVVLNPEDRYRTPRRTVKQAREGCEIIGQCQT